MYLGWPIPNARCRVPRDLAPITCLGEEASTGIPEIGPQSLERIWGQVEKLYRSGAHPAIQLCIRHNGRRVLNRGIGHAYGNAPDDPPDSPKSPLTLDTPINLFSSAKAVSAMVIHKLDEENVLRLDDRVCDYIPEFSGGGKHRITLRHVLAHRAGVPNLPAEALDIDTLSDSEKVMEYLCEAKLASRPGRALAYHAVTGGYILAEVVKRAAGRNMRVLMREKISDPLGLQWLGCGVAADQVDLVAENALTGFPVPPPLKQLLKRALGFDLQEVVRLSNHPLFLGSIIPAANVCTTADEINRFYDCLLRSGEWRGEQVFEPRTVRHATAEQTYWELDLTFGVPVRYGLGFMLGSPLLGVFGRNNPNAFGHLGLSNNLTWADPERGISVALLTTGKPIIGPHVIPLLLLVNEINSVFDKKFAEEPSEVFRPPTMRD